MALLCPCNKNMLSKFDNRVKSSIPILGTIGTKYIRSMLTFVEYLTCEVCSLFEIEL